MQLMRVDEAPAGPFVEREFRYSRVGATVGALLLLGGAGVLAWFARMRSEPLLYYVAGVLVFMLVLTRRMVLARFQPSNWLVRVDGEGLFIHFRSYLNQHFPADDATVVRLLFRDIREIRELTVRRVQPSQGGVQAETRRFVELELSGDTGELACALQAEASRPAPARKRWYGSTSVRYGHQPVQLVDGNRLRIRWEVTPGIAAFLRLVGNRAIVAPSVRLVEDDTKLPEAPRLEQEDRLLALVESGERLAAIKLVRRLYGYRLSEAKRFVDDLTAKE